MLTKTRLLKMLAICSALATFGAIASEHIVTPIGGLPCAADKTPTFYYDHNKAGIADSSLFVHYNGSIYIDKWIKIASWSNPSNPTAATTKMIPDNDADQRGSGHWAFGKYPMNPAFAEITTNTFQVTYDVKDDPDDFVFNVVVFDPSTPENNYVHGAVTCEDQVEPCAEWTLVAAKWLTADESYDQVQWGDGRHAQNKLPDVSLLKIRKEVDGEIQGVISSGCGAFKMTPKGSGVPSPFNFDEDTGKITNVSGVWPVPGASPQTFSFTVTVSLAKTSIQREQLVAFTMKGSCDSEHWTETEKTQAVIVPAQIKGTIKININVLIEKFSFASDQAHCSNDYSTIIELPTESKLHIINSGDRIYAKQVIPAFPHTEKIQVVFKHLTKSQELTRKEVEIVVDTTCTEDDLVAEKFSVTYPDELIAIKGFEIKSTTQQNTMTKCLTRYSLLSQKQYTTGTELSDVTHFEVLNLVYRDSFFVNPIVAHLPIGTYEVKISSQTGSMTAPVIFTVLIHNSDPCYTRLDSIDVDPNDLLEATKFTWGSPYVQTLPNIPGGLTDICKFGLTKPVAAVHSSGQTWPIDSIETNADGSVKINFSALSQENEAANSYISGAEFEFTVKVDYADKSYQLKYKVTKPDPCAQDDLKVTTDCAAPTTIHAQYNIKKEFGFIDNSCTFVYFPNACHPLNRPIIVKLSGTPTQNVFKEKDSLTTFVTDLVQDSQYNRSNQLSIQYDVLTPQSEPRTTPKFQLQYSFGGKLFGNIDFDFIVEPCRCASWKLSKHVDQEITYLSEAELKFVSPECIDVPQCQMGPQSWNIILTAEKETSGPAAASFPVALDSQFFSKSAASEPILTLKQTPIATQTEVYQVSVQYEYIDVMDPDAATRSQSEKFKATFKPCYCKTYAIPSIFDVEHKFSDAALEVQVEQAACTGDSVNCLVVSAFNYEAKQADGIALNSGEITFDAAKMVLIIDQSINSVTPKTVNVMISASTDEITLAQPVQQTFKVTLEPLIEKTTITVEPSLSRTFQMSFQDKYEQVFKFKTLDQDASLEIKANKHPFIETRLGADDDLLISVDGPSALAFTLAQTDRTEQISIRVNDQTFKFKIRLTLTDETQGTNEEKKDETTTTTTTDFTTTNFTTTGLSKWQSSMYGNLQRQKVPDDPKRPKITASVDIIQSNGEIKITFEPPIATVPEQWQQYFHESELLKFDAKVRAQMRELAKEFLSVTFISNSEGLEQTHFSYNLTEFTSEGVTISLNFSDPLFVSQGDGADMVRIQLQKEFFMSPWQNSWTRQRFLAQPRMYDDGQFITLYEELPLMMSSQQEFERIASQAESTETALGAQFIGSFVLQVFVSGALSMLWNIFNTLQILFALNLFMVVFPANIEFFQLQLEDIINLQIIPKGFIYEEVLQPAFDLETLEEIKQRDMDIAQQMQENQEEPASRGLTSKFFGTSLLMNVLTLLLVFIFFVAVILLVVCCKYVVLPVCPGCCKTIISKVERKLFWNSVLRACLEMYLATGILFFNSMGNMETNDDEGRIKYLSWLAMGAFLFGLPFITFRVLFKRWGILQQSEVKERFDSLYQNVDVHKGPIAFAFTFYFCLRRLAFAFIIGQVRRTIVFQIYMADIISTLMLIYFIAIMPMVDRLNNATQIFNELIVLICIQSMFLFTNYVADPVIRHEMGHKLLYVVAFNVVINFAILFFTLVQKIYRGIRNWYIRRITKKAMQRKINEAPKKLKKNEPKIESSSSKSRWMSNDPESESSSSSESSWRSSFSDSESDSEDSEASEEVPSRKQIRFFTTNRFRKEFDRIERQWQGQDDQQMLERQRPGIVEQFLEYQKFKHLGYHFSIKRRAAKRFFNDDVPMPTINNLPLPNIQTTPVNQQRRYILENFRSQGALPQQRDVLPWSQQHLNENQVEIQRPQMLHSVQHYEQEIDDIINYRPQPQAPIIVEESKESANVRNSRNLLGERPHQVSQQEKNNRQRIGREQAILRSGQ